MQEARKFVIQLCRSHLEQGRHFVCEIPVHCSNCDEAAQLEKESNVRSVVIDNIVKDEVRSSPWTAKDIDAVRFGSQKAEMGEKRGKESSDKRRPDMGEKRGKESYDKPRPEMGEKREARTKLVSSSSLIARKLRRKYPCWRLQRPS